MFQNQNANRKEPAEQGSRLVEFPQKERTASTRYLFFYVVGIFSIAVLLMVLSYLSQSRSQEQTELLMSTHSEFSIAAMQNLDKLREENSGLREELSAVMLENQELNTRLESADAVIAGLESEKNSLESQLDEALSRAAALRAELDDVISAAAAEDSVE